MFSPPQICREERKAVFWWWIFKVVGACLNRCQVWGTREHCISLRGVNMCCFRKGRNILRIQVWRGECFANLMWRHWKLASEEEQNVLKKKKKKFSFMYLKQLWLKTFYTCGLWAPALPPTPCEVLGCYVTSLSLFSHLHNREIGLNYLLNSFLLYLWSCDMPLRCRVKIHSYFLSREGVTTTVQERVLLSA